MRNYSLLLINFYMALFAAGVTFPSEGIEIYEGPGGWTFERNKTNFDQYKHHLKACLQNNYYQDTTIPNKLNELIDSIVHNNKTKGLPNEYKTHVNSTIISFIDIIVSQVQEKRKTGTLSKEMVTWVSTIANTLKSYSKTVEGFPLDESTKLKLLTGTNNWIIPGENFLDDIAEPTTPASAWEKEYLLPLCENLFTECLKLFSDPWNTFSYQTFKQTIRKVNQTINDLPEQRSNQACVTLARAAKYITLFQEAIENVPVLMSLLLKDIITLEQIPEVGTLKLDCINCIKKGKDLLKNSPPQVKQPLNLATIRDKRLQHLTKTVPVRNLFYIAETIKNTDTATTEQPKKENPNEPISQPQPEQQSQPQKPLIQQETLQPANPLQPKEENANKPSAIQPATEKPVNCPLPEQPEKQNQPPKIALVAGTQWPFFAFFTNHYGKLAFTAGLVISALMISYLLKQKPAQQPLVTAPAHNLTFIPELFAHNLNVSTNATQLLVKPLIATQQMVNTRNLSLALSA